MKKLILIAGLALCAAAVYGQKQKLVVAPFENKGAKVDAAALNNLQEFLINAFSNTGRFQVPDRSALNLLAAEQQFQLSDWADDAKSAQMGKVLNADYIVRVLAMHDGEMNLLSARILDVNTANVLSAAEMEFSTQRDARGKMDDFVGKIVQRIAGGGTPAATAAAAAPAQKTGEYKVGERGPAGGWVFYDKGRVINGWRYLEAAPAETETTAEWGAYRQDVANTSLGVGSGKRNTELIVAFLKRTRETGRAAQWCDALSFDGFDDWFLPNKDELNLMYQNLKAKGLGEFGSGGYWSSSQDVNYTAWYQNFGSGGQGNPTKNSTYPVRAVRAF